MSRFSLQWEIQQRDAGRQIKEFLKDQEISKASLTAIKFQGGKIAVNGVEATVRRVLQTGEKLIVEFPEELRSEGLTSEHLPLEIMYEDPYILVVNKQAGMSTIPSREHPTGSLAHALLGYYERSNVMSTIHIVTRLDRDTSGLVLVAKHRHIHHLISKEQQKGAVQRTYEALCEGAFSEHQGVIKEPIGRKDESIIERIVRPDGQYACTFFEVLAQYESFAHMRLRLETGRTHQIRVHLSFIGHPLLGDDLYGGSTELLTRQALHCREISFFHPIFKKVLHFTAPLPQDLQMLFPEK